MDEAIASGAVTVEASDIAALHECQPHQAVKKDGMNARLQAIADEGGIGPVFRHARLDEAAARRDTAFYETSRAGTRERIRKGASRESLP